MANFTTKSSDNIRINQPDNTDIFSVNIAVSHHEWTNEALMPSDVVAVTKTDNQPQALTSNAYTTVSSINYHDDFFERIYITPTLTDVGFVVSPTNFNAYVYNAYLQDSQEFTAINSVNNEDAALIGQSAPYTMQATEELEYTISVPAEGNAVISTTHEWDFDTANDVLTTIQGIRLVLFSFKPEMPYLERLEWSTDVMTSKNGIEQRIARSTVARQILEHRFVNDDRHKEQLMRTWITGQMGKQFGLPIWAEQKKYTSNIPSGTGSLTFDTSYMDLRDDSLMVIWKDYDNFEVITIDTVAPASVTFTRDTLTDFTAPVLLMPVRVAYIDGRISGTLNTIQAYDRSISFKVNDNTEITGYSADTTYLGFPVLTECQFFERDTQEETFSADSSIIDYQGNNFVQINDYLTNRTGFNFGVERFGLEDNWQLRQLLHYLKGKFKPVFIPSGRHDMTLAVDALSTDVNIQIENIDYSRFLDHDNYRAYICIALDGVLNFYTVQSAQLLGNGNEQLIFSLYGLLFKITPLS